MSTHDSLSIMRRHRATEQTATRICKDQQVQKLFCRLLNNLQRK